MNPSIECFFWLIALMTIRLPFKFEALDTHGILVVCSSELVAEFQHVSRWCSIRKDRKNVGWLDELLRVAGHPMA